MDVMGVDPGQRGAAALLRRDWNRHGRFDYQFLDMVDLPMLPDGETRKQIDVPFLGALIERWNPDIAVIENVQVAVYGADDPRASQTAAGSPFRRSSMGPADAFRFGLACGMIRATVLAYEVPLELVHPRTWTGYFDLKGGDKKPHIAKIKEIAPTSERFITLAKHEGRADAGLIALWYAMKTGML